VAPIIRYETAKNEEMLMKTRLLSTLSICFSALVISGYADAALVDRGGGLIYDTGLDVTWLQNANASGNITTPDAASAWASSLIYHDAIRNVDWDDWRLPEDDLSCSGPDNCSDSEMGHLFYIESVTFSTPTPFFNLQSGFYWFGTPTGLGARSFEFITGITALDVSFYDPAYAWAVRDGDVVPIPAAFWLFGSGLVGLIGLARYRAV
jgi:hypothetical protein